MALETENDDVELADLDQLREPSTGRFLPGHAAHPGAGRPRKGETLAERLAKADAAVARKAIKARDARLMREDQTGNRAWENYLAYRVGLPKQPFSMTVEDSPLLAFLTRHNDRPYVEAEFTATDITPAQVRSPDTGESDTVHK